MKNRYAIPAIVGAFIGGAVFAVKYGPAIVNSVVRTRIRMESKQALFENAKNLTSEMLDEIDRLTLPGDPNFDPKTMNDLLEQSGLKKSDFEAAVTRRLVHDSKRSPDVTAKVVRRVWADSSNGDDDVHMGLGNPR